MTDDLITRLRGYAACMDIDAYASCDEAADALEKQAKQIAELEYMNNSILSANNELGFAFTERDEARARIAELKAALKPFADMAEQLPIRQPEYADDEEFDVEYRHLRAARAAYLGEKD